MDNRSSYGSPMLTARLIVPILVSLTFSTPALGAPNPQTCSCNFLNLAFTYQCCFAKLDYSVKQSATIVNYTLTSDFNKLKTTVSTIQNDVSNVETGFSHFLFDSVPEEVTTTATTYKPLLQQGFQSLKIFLEDEQASYFAFSNGDQECTDFQTGLLHLLYGVEDTVESGAYIGESLARIGLALAEIGADLGSTPTATEFSPRGRNRGARASRISMSSSFASTASGLCPDVEPPPPLVHLDPQFFLRKLGIKGAVVSGNGNVCSLLWPAHTVIRALGVQKIDDGKCTIPTQTDPARCVIDPLLGFVDQLSTAMAQAKDTFYALECQIDHEAQESKNRLCTAIANLANQTALNPNGTVKAGWEHWQGYANILKGGGGLAQQIGTMLQGIGDVSINGWSLGASVALEGDLRSGIDYANAIGKNLARLGGDAVWLGEEIDKMTSFCRGNLNLKLMICMLQQNKAQDYDDCYAGVLDPISVDQDFGF